MLCRRCIDKSCSVLYVVSTSSLCADTITVPRHVPTWYLPLVSTGRYVTDKRNQWHLFHPMVFVVLLRVSTQKQGGDGHGIAAQRRDIQHFLNQHPETPVIKELVEVESGGKELHERPVLQEAIELSQKTNSTIVIATLSRLSRDAAFVLTLDERHHHQVQSCCHAISGQPATGDLCSAERGREAASVGSYQGSTGSSEGKRSEVGQPTTGRAQPQQETCRP